MINLVKGAINNVMSKPGSNSDGKGNVRPPPKPEKFIYARPMFLGLTGDEIQGSRDFGLRPIVIPRQINQIPLYAGYAECINGGKSDYNEDQGCACVINLKSKSGADRKGAVRPKSDPLHYESPVWPESRNSDRNSHQQMVDVASGELNFPVQMIYYGLFDGHAGYRVSLIASRLLHKHVQDKLELCLDVILQKSENKEDIFDGAFNITVDDLVRGALEEAFAEMDSQLEREGTNFLIKGGCTALVVVMFYGKVYIANAGDCRAVMLHEGKTTQMSKDFTPESEKQRINYVGFCQPELLHDEFSCHEFHQRVNKCDVGKRMLCRRPGRDGWVYKTVTDDDLKFPLIIGSGKKARVMGTIGVTRGLGDHDLYVFDSNIWIKPFLSSQPEVRVIDLSEGTWTDNDVIIIGSDGLWDMISNDEAGDIVSKIFSQPNNTPQNKYTIAAQELVSEARGTFTGQGWKRKDGSQASFDDITAMVIPIKLYLDKWRDSSNLDEDVR